MSHLNEPVKLVLDALAIVFSFFVWLASIVPALASTVTLAWGILRFYLWWKGRKDGNVKLD